LPWPANKLKSDIFEDLHAAVRKDVDIRMEFEQPPFFCWEGSADERQQAESTEKRGQPAMRIVAHGHKKCWPRESGCWGGWITKADLGSFAFCGGGDFKEFALLEAKHAG